MLQVSEPKIPHNTSKKLMKAVFYVFIFCNFKNAKIYSRLVKLTDLLSEQVSEVSDTKINIGQIRFLMVSRKVSEEVSRKTLIHLLKNFGPEASID